MLVGCDADEEMRTLDPDRVGIATRTALGLELVGIEVENQPVLDLVWPDHAPRRPTDPWPRRGRGPRGSAWAPSTLHRVLAPVRSGERS